jgi:hypothetical protein
MKWAQGIENACSVAIANFAAVYDQGLAGGRNAAAGCAKIRFRFVSLRFAWFRLVAPCGDAARRLPWLCASRFIFSKPSVFAAP